MSNRLVLGAVGLRGAPSSRNPLFSKGVTVLVIARNIPYYIGMYRHPDKQAAAHSTHIGSVARTLRSEIRRTEMRSSERVAISADHGPQHGETAQDVSKPTK